MGNYCFSCSFFLSLRDGSNTLTHSHYGNYPAVSFISHSGPKVQNADSSLANIQLSNRPEMVTKMKGALMRLEEWPQSVELVARAVLTRVDPIGFFLYSDLGERERALLLLEYRIPPKNDQNMKSMYVSVFKPATTRFGRVDSSVWTVLFHYNVT